MTDENGAKLVFKADELLENANECWKKNDFANVLHLHGFRNLSRFG